MVIFSILTACTTIASIALVHFLAFIRMMPPTETYMGMININGKYSSMVGFRGAPHTLFSNGRNVANFFVVLKNEVTRQVSPIWYFGEPTPMRGGGQFIGRKGEYNLYYFLLLEEGAGFEFLPGRYTMEVYVDVSRKPKRIFKKQLMLSADLAVHIKERNAYVTFVWLSNVRKYIGRIATNVIKMPEASGAIHPTVNG